MEKKNKVLFVLFFIFILLNISDVITTLFIIDGEANPLYLFTGKIWIIYLIKIFIIYMIWKVYKRNTYPSHFTYHLLLSILVYGCLVLLIAQIININAILNPVLIEAASEVEPSARATQYFWFMNLFYLMPILFSSFIFWLYDKSKDSVFIDKEMDKNKKWWKRW